MPSSATRCALAALFAIVLLGQACAAETRQVFLEEMTSPEVRQAIQAGTTILIIPVGGTEQNGPHMALGKHNTRVHLLAGRIAATLGNAIVAPVLAYVPEGSINPPSAHMRWAGTISIGDDAFKAVLDGAARSFAHHGFTDIVLIGDHGGYQSQLGAVAAKLNRDWAGKPPRAHFIAAYYLATQAGFIQALRSVGLSNTQIGSHAGSADTALMLATAPALVRPDALESAARNAPGNGVVGDPRAATADLGRLGTDAVVNASVAAIRAAVGARR
jgi:creatinine amidohydrolase